VHLLRLCHLIVDELLRDCALRFLPVLWDDSNRLDSFGSLGAQKRLPSFTVSTMSRQLTLNQMVASLKQTGTLSSMDVDELINRKLQLEQELAKLERQIYNLETSYLENTSNSPLGNLVTGWGDFENARSLHDATTKKKQLSIPDEHRIFTNSSATAAKHINQLKKPAVNNNNNNNNSNNNNTSNRASKQKLSKKKNRRKGERETDNEEPMSV